IESLQKTGVLAVMDKEFKLFKDAEKMHIMTFLEQAPTHPVIYCTDSSIDVQYSLVHFNVSLEKNSEALIYSKISGVGAQATLAEVYELLQSARDGAVYVYGRTHSDIIGVITWHKLRNYLHQASY
ncbi:MAG: chloride channel protein, partial [Paraglaciecola sp.]|nr:chloride channel protein [Paraglaciecola sp.]